MRYSYRKKSCERIETFMSHTDNLFLNLVNLTRFRLYLRFFRFIEHLTVFRLVLNSSESCDCSPNYGLVKQVSKWSSLYVMMCTLIVFVFLILFRLREV